MMTDTGAIVRMLRNRLKWSRMKLSDKSGVQVATISSVENKTDCRLSTFEKLIEAMGYEIEIYPKEKRRV